MVAEGSPGRLKNSRGIALVLTLMVVAIVTAMVVEFAYGVYTNTTALYNWQISQQLSLAARSGTTLAARLLTQSNSGPELAFPGFVEISQKIPYADLDGTITLRIEDENAKFNLRGGLNLSGVTDKDKDPYEVFTRLLSELHLDAGIARRVAYWQDANTEHHPGDSASVSKNAPLDSVDEIALIPGIDRKSYERLLPYVTIYGDNQTNVNTASVPVLMSLTSAMSRDLAERIVQYRNATPFTSQDSLKRVMGYDQIGDRLNGYLLFRGRAFRVIATAESGGIKRIIECVLEGSGSNWKVKYWKEM